MRDLSGTTLVLLAVVAVLLAAVLVVALVFLVRLLKLWSLVQNGRMPVQGKLAFWGALIYAIFPVDVLPDPIYLDDVGVLVAAIAYIGNLARKNGLIGGSANQAEPISGRSRSGPNR